MLNLVQRTNHVWIEQIEISGLSCFLWLDMYEYEYSVFTRLERPCALRSVHYDVSMSKFQPTMICRASVTNWQNEYVKKLS